MQAQKKASHSGIRWAQFSFVLYISGFTDWEGCSSVSFIQDAEQKRMNLGIEIRSSFSISKKKSEKYYALFFLSYQKGVEMWRNPWLTRREEVTNMKHDLCKTLYVMWYLLSKSIHFLQKRQEGVRTFGFFQRFVRSEQLNNVWSRRMLCSKQKHWGLQNIWIFLASVTRNFSIESLQLLLERKTSGYYTAWQIRYIHRCVCCSLTYSREREQ